MRTITTHTSVTVYTLDELSDSAKTQAVENVREKLGGEWWDESDNDDIRDVMMWTLAEQLGTPGHLDYGIGDYPGIPNISIAGWDLDRGQNFLVTGSFTRENAPKLPWVDGLEYIKSEAKSDHNYLTCVSDTLTSDEVDAAGANAVQALRNALHAAWNAGREEMEYKSSKEYAREWIDANKAEFTENGDLC